MTKSELLSTYTAEQLAEMEKLYRDIAQCREHSGEHLHSEEYLKILSLNRTISGLQSEVEKYRKAFEEAKNERDCQIAELIDEKEPLETRLKLLKSERDDLREEDEKLKKAQDFSDLTPIEVANMLINAEGEYEHNPITKALYKEDKGTYRIFDIGELRQIAEHLLIYCNHNKEEEE